jgi:succinate dehydrogenase/fumarate reductase flavoprotein subunit
MPWSDQDASGELAAMAIGGSLWGFYNQTGEFGIHLSKPVTIGCQYNYRGVKWMPGSPVFHKARASGLTVMDWQNAIMVNMIGNRFYDETEGQFTANNYNHINPYRHGDWRNGGGPIWAIFNADAVEREKWHPAPPDVDIDAGFFFSAGTIGELASKVEMKYQRVPMPPANLEATIARYNSFVDSGVDEDFGKPHPAYKIARPPFYAAWATPAPHDSRAGLRINPKCQVVDLNGQVIPGLYCGGESAGGFSQHGLARAICQGYIAGNHAHAEGG